MKNNTGVFRVILSISAVIGMVLFPATAYANDGEDSDTNDGVILIEVGEVVNPEALLFVAPDSELADFSDSFPTADRAKVQYRPTWKNPEYSSPTTRAVGQSDCTSQNYKVITKVGGQLGAGYMYSCWTGSGYYYNATAFPTYGFGVTAVCPGNNKGAILIQAYWNTADYWNWSTYRGPYPNNGDSYCFYFDTYMKYKAVKLNV